MSDINASALGRVAAEMFGFDCIDSDEPYLEVRRIMTTLASLVWERWNKRGFANKPKIEAAEKERDEAWKAMESARTVSRQEHLAAVENVFKATAKVVSLRRVFATKKAEEEITQMEAEVKSILDSVRGAKGKCSARLDLRPRADAVQRNWSDAQRESRSTFCSMWKRKRLRKLKISTIRSSTGWMTWMRRMRD